MIGLPWHVTQAEFGLTAWQATGLRWDALGTHPTSELQLQIHLGCDGTGGWGCREHGLGTSASCACSWCPCSLWIQFGTD